MPDDSLLFYSGLFALHARSATALRQILEDYFDVPVEVEQFVGAWYPLDDDRINADCDRVMLSPSSWASAPWSATRFGTRQSGVRVSSGPTDAQAVHRFSSGGHAPTQPLRAITRFFSGDEIDFEVQLVLKRDEVPACELRRCS